MCIYKYDRLFFAEKKRGQNLFLLKKITFFFYLFTGIVQDVCRGSRQARRDVPQTTQSTPDGALPVCRCQLPSQPLCQPRYRPPSSLPTQQR